MTVRVIVGDCRTVLAELPDASVACRVTSTPRDGRFRKGQHWRRRKPHWDREWLVAEYVEKGRSTGDIAAEIGTTDANVLYWLRKHGIARRSISEARGLKHWGVTGAANPMFGKRGAANPRYVDGSSPERQRGYVTTEGRAFLRSVYQRDGFKCRRCSASKDGPRSIHAHHVRPWAGNKALRFEVSNAVTLCRSCHSWVHSNANTDREWLA